MAYAIAGHSEENDFLDMPRKKALVEMEFPCVIDVKVFLNARENNFELVRDVLLQSIDSEDLHDISRKESKRGKYHSFSCRINATDREQIDRLFQHLSSHPEVLMVI